MSKVRLAVVLSHPVQYVSPLLVGLARHVDLTVFYGMRPTPEEQSAEFGMPFSWDVNLLDGYRHQFLRNVSPSPGVERYGGCDAPEIAESIRGGGFHAVVVFGWYLKMYVQAIRACRRYSVPVFIRGDSTLLTSGSGTFKRIIKKAIGPTLLNSVTGHLYPGVRNREYLEHFGARADRLFFVPHCVDNQFFRSRPPDARAAFRRANSISDGEFVALFVGKLIAKKRPHDFVNAIARLQGVCGVVVGDGELRSDLEALAARTGAKIRFAGFRNQSELPAVYAAADLIVLPSESESWGLVINEAMAAGIGAITSDRVGCAPDLIRPGETGFTFRCGDVEQLAARIEEYRRIHALSPGKILDNLKQTMNAYSIDAATSGLLRAVDG